MLMLLRHYMWIVGLCLALLSSSPCFAQRRSIPWSASLHQTFGRGASLTAPPLQKGHTDFTWSANACPPSGSYSIVKSVACPGVNGVAHDAGHIFLNGRHLESDDGYLMLVQSPLSALPRIAYSDTARNLCSNRPYLLWVALLNVNPLPCSYPNFTINVESLTGTVIASFETGDLGRSDDRGTWFPGFFDANRRPPFIPYYGGYFTLPAGVTDVVIKIIQKRSAFSNGCDVAYVMDNIILDAVGPELTILPSVNPDAWIASTCFQTSTPLVINSRTEPGYVEFGTGRTIGSVVANPRYQWQQSTDDGYTWIDIAGETNQTLSHIFSIEDTFYVRLRMADASVFTNLNCNVYSNVVQVQVDGLPKEFSVKSNSPACTNSDLKFELAGGARYMTTGPNGFWDDSPFPHIFSVSHKDTGWYNVQIISLGGCGITERVHVQVRGPHLQTSSGAEVCYGEKVRLSASGGEAYEWSPAEGLSSRFAANPIATVLKTTTYTVTATDNSGCSDTGNIKLTLKNAPLIAAFSSTDVACPGDNIAFRDESTGYFTGWTWNFGDGRTSEDRHPVIKYPASNGIVNYSVSLTVTDTTGCTNTATKLVKAVNNCLINVPNAFTPNGDGNNDFLYPLNAYKATQLTFRVYNRWGRVVHETKDWENKWDGKVNSTPQPTGGYTWTLQYTDRDGKQVSLRGTTILIR